MDFIRITLSGFGYDIQRDIITEKEYKKMEETNSLDNIWFKGLNKYLDDKCDKIKIQNDYGMYSGDLIVEVNDEVVLDIPISILDEVDNKVVKETYEHPKTNDIVMTTLQKHSGVISDMCFMSLDKFDVSDLGFTFKTIQGEDGFNIIDRLLSEIDYRGSSFKFNFSDTELLGSNVYFDNKKNNPTR